MRGMAATVTSCIGGKDEKFAVQVKAAAPQSVYFVYKTMSQFDALWSSLETLARDIKSRKRAREQALAEGADEATMKAMPKLSMMAKWLASVVDHYAFRRIIEDLRAQEKETMSTLNVFLQFLVSRVSALYVENTILRCGTCRVARQLAKLVRDFLEVTPETEVSLKSAKKAKEARKRNYSEMRPEDSEEQRETKSASISGPSASLFPIRGSGERSAKTQKLCGMREFCIPPIGKVPFATPMVAPVASRRRVFTEVEF